MSTRFFTVIGSAPLLACTAIVAAATIDVPADFATVQDAADAASTGDVVEVADGTWGGVQIVGKTITLRSASGDAENCVLLGSGTTLLLFGGGNDSVVQNMTLKGSRGLAVEGGASGTIEGCVVRADVTGGVFFNGVALTMRGCEISDCRSPNAGAGVLFTDGDLELIDCVFLDNQVTTPTGRGGGVFSSDAGGSVLITGCLFDGNSAPGATLGRGGALYLERKTDVTIVDCQFTGNEASSEGGGAYLALSSALFMNCRFSQNASGGGGGGLWIDNAGAAPNLVTMTNCLVDRNDAGGGSGGGIRQLLDSNLVLGNSTIASNTATGGGSGVANAAGSTVTATNSIVRGNNNGQIAGAGVEFVMYSNIQGGFAGAGNIDLDSQWVNPRSGDFHLQASSPSIDAGNTLAYSGLPADLDGNARLVDAPGMPDTGIGIGGNTVDMGCYEFAEAETSCVGDVTNDGSVGFDDLVTLLGAWGPCP